MDRPIILCGLGLVGRRVLDHLQAFGHPIVVVTTGDQSEVLDLPEGSIRLVRGDCRRPEVLEEAGITNARGILILTSDDMVNVAAALVVRRLNPEVRIVVRMFNQGLVEHLDKAVHRTAALSVSGLAAPRMARRALESDLQTTFENTERGLQHVVELEISAESPLNGLSIADVFRRFRLLSVAHERPDQETKILMSLDFDEKLRPGDTLTVSGTPQEIAAARPPAGEGIFTDVLWAGKIRRGLRVLRRTLLEVDLSVKIVGAVLAFVLLLGALVYHYFLEFGWVDSLYSTVAVMSTEESMGGDQYQGQPMADEAKLFIVFMKIMGVVLIASFTAIFTNFLIRARLDSALEVRRIPDGGHFVVCGLGNIGYRIVEELIRAGERVVVIDEPPVGNFVATVRRQGVAVITGDATVTEVLQQAHVPTARAVIAATSNELTNLEIALLVQQLNPKMRVVVRLSDPMLADALREQANVPLAVSIPALSAPAFVAALFEDRVQTVFRAGDQELVVVDLVVDAHESNLVGQTLQAVATDYNLLPVGLSGADPGASRDSASYRLRPGDRVTLFTTPRDLGRLSEREPIPANWSIEIVDYPFTAKAELTVRLTTSRNLTQEEAKEIVEQSPFLFAQGLTRGQAEEWVRLLKRERVTTRLVQSPEASVS